MRQRRNLGSTRSFKFSGGRGQEAGARADFIHNLIENVKNERPATNFAGLGTKPSVHYFALGPAPAAR